MTRDYLWKMCYAISNADAFAAATAEKVNAVLVTGDPEPIALKDKLKLAVLERG